MKRAQGPIRKRPHILPPLTMIQGSVSSPVDPLQPPTIVTVSTSGTYLIPNEILVFFGPYSPFPDRTEVRKSHSEVAQTRGGRS